MSLSFTLFFDLLIVVDLPTTCSGVFLPFPLLYSPLTCCCNLFYVKALRSFTCQLSTLAVLSTTSSTLLNSLTQTQRYSTEKARLMCSTGL